MQPGISYGSYSSQFDIWWVTGSGEGACMEEEEGEKEEREKEGPSLIPSHLLLIALELCKHMG
jgi:hypothetical protein